MEEAKNKIRIRKSMSNGKDYVIVEEDSNNDRILDQGWQPVKYKPTGTLKYEDNIGDQPTNC